MKKVIFILTIAVLLFACKSNKYTLNYPQNPEIFGLASPIKLEPNVSVVWLTDYFPRDGVVDSVGRIDGLDFSFPSGKLEKMFIKVIADSLPWLMNLDVWANGYKYSIPVFRSPKRVVRYEFDPKGKKYSQVYFCSEINSWQMYSVPLVFDTVKGVWYKYFYLKPGKYQYKLVIENQCITDPNNPDSVPNGLGGYNSVLIVKGNPDADNFKVLPYTFDFDGRYVEIKLSDKVRNFLIYWQNVYLDEKFWAVKDNILKIRIPEDAKKMKRSYIRVYFASENGILNDILVPLDYGKVVSKPKQLNRFDFHRMVIYNIMVDRFYNGNPDNDEPITNDTVLPKANFMGGDLVGILKKLNDGYFDSLGVNAIWISPIMQNVKGAYGLWKEPKTKFSAYHGYWITSFAKIDYRFGTEQDLHQLVNALHNKQMNLILDFVAHHVHENSWFYKEHPTWVTNLYLPDGTLNVEKWDTHRLTTWFDVFLPTIDNSRPEVYEMVSDSAVWWIKTFNLDGFRHDAAKHVPLIFWRTLTRKLKLQVEIPENRPVYQIGETYGNVELISSYIGSGLLDAQFDFNVYFTMLRYFVMKDAGNDLKRILLESWYNYGWHNLMGYITGNQDQGRLTSFLEKTIPLFAPPNQLKAIGWTQNIQVKDSSVYQKVANVFAFIASIPGIPVIYYGDEIGLPGAGDPDNRRMMTFNLSKKQQELFNNVACILKTRTNSLPLIYGDIIDLQITDTTYLIVRNYFSQQIAIAINNSNSNFKLNLPVEKILCGKLIENQFVPPNSYAIFQLKTKH